VLGQERSARSRRIDAILWVTTLVLLVASFVLSWGAPLGLGPKFGLADKVWHLLGYGALCLTLLLAAAWRPGRGEGRFPRSGRAAALLVLAIAWITEVLQAPFGRDAELADAVADLAGVVVGFLAWRMLPRSL
jgi:hypothetical protein